MTADEWVSLVASVLVPLCLRVAVHVWPLLDGTPRHARRRTTSQDGGH